MAGEPSRTGYIPLSFVEPLPVSSAEPSAASEIMSNSSVEVSENLNQTKVTSPAQTAFDNASTAYAAKLAATSTSTIPNATSTALVGVPPGTALSHGLSAAEEFGALFASHEEWFRAATKKRAEVYQSLHTETADLLRAVQEGENRSTAVMNRIAELDSLLAKEKASWQALNGAPVI